MCVCGRYVARCVYVASCVHVARCVCVAMWRAVCVAMWRAVCVWLCGELHHLNELLANAIFL
jgi:hypothetical protein